MLSKITSSLLSLFIVCCTLTSHAEAASSAKKLCSNKKGAIIIRSACLKGEKSVSPSTFNSLLASVQSLTGTVGPQGPTGPVGPSGSQGSQGVVGVKGPKGDVNVAGCRISTYGYDTNFSTPADPIAYAETYCNPSTEFILEDEYKVNLFPGSAGTDVSIQARSPYTQTINGDTREYGVGIYANRTNIVGEGKFELIVKAVCCPR